MNSAPQVSSTNEPQLHQFPRIWTRYFFATRPNFLSLTFVLCLPPLSMIQGKWSPFIFIQSLLAALLLHAAGNILNDVADHQNGTDPNNDGRIYPFTGGSRFIQNQILSVQAMHRFGYSCLTLAFILGAGLAFKIGSEVVILGILGASFAWAYSLPPLRLNSRGWGELCVGASFGLLPIGMHFVLTETWTSSAIWVGMVCGIMTLALLHINEFPDAHSDALAGKRHWVVRMSRTHAVWTHALILSLAYCIHILGIYLTILPTTAWIVCGVLPISIWIMRELARFAPRPERLKRALILSILSAHAVPLLYLLAFFLN